MRKVAPWVLIFMMLLSCNLPPGATAIPVSSLGSPTQPAGSPPTVLPLPTITLTLTLFPSSTSTVTPTPTLLPSDTPTATPIPTQTATPTLAQLIAVSKANSSCLYGPNIAYLYMYALTPGGTAEIHGRNDLGSWLWVQPTGTQMWCWVEASLLTVPVDIKSVPVERPPLPTNASVPRPTGVHATRNGTSVTIYWNAAPASVQLAYLIEASICTKGNSFDVVYTTTNISYALTDDKTCGYPSSGQLRVQNKLGYSTAVKIPWP